jgi:hypothetical protein
LPKRPRSALSGVQIIGLISHKYRHGAKASTLAEAREGEVLKRLGLSRESAVRLGRKAAEAEAVIGIHGVSVTAGLEIRPHVRALRARVEEVFRVHDTPTRHDRLHRTVELPKPVTSEIADQFNRVFGRV